MGKLEELKEDLKIPRAEGSTAHFCHKRALTLAKEVDELEKQLAQAKKYHSAAVRGLHSQGKKFRRLMELYDPGEAPCSCVKEGRETCYKCQDPIRYGKGVVWMILTKKKDRALEIIKERDKDVDIALQGDTKDGTLPE